MRIRAELRELVAAVENLVENCGGITRNLVEHLFYHKFLVKMAGSTVHEGVSAWNGSGAGEVGR